MSSVTAEAVRHAGPTSAQKLVIHPSIALVTFTGMSGVGKNHAAEMTQAMSGGDLLQSIVTRKLRKGQDKEYHKVSDDQFDVLQGTNRFLWWVWGDERTELTRDADMHKDVQRDRYGTLGEDIDRALASEIPSVMHLVHDKVRELHDYVDRWDQGRRVLSFVVACKSDKMVRQRIITRQPSLDLAVVDRRVANFYERQNNYLESGLYHALIVSRDDKSDEELREELAHHLASPVPEPRKFSL